MTSIHVTGNLTSPIVFGVRELLGTKAIVHSAKSLPDAAAVSPMVVKSAVTQICEYLYKNSQLLANAKEYLDDNASVSDGNIDRVAKLLAPWRL
jgi:hypothetical protein